MPPMGLLARWADRQERKRDIRKAIESSLYHASLFVLLRSALGMLETSPEAATRFDRELRVYIASVLEDVRLSETRLYGFRGPADQWVDAQTAIVSQGLKVDGSRSRQIGVAAFIEQLCRRLLQISAELDLATLSTRDARAALMSAYGSAQSSLEWYEGDLWDEASTAGLLNDKDHARMRDRAVRQVAKVVRGI